MNKTSLNILKYPNMDTKHMAKHTVLPANYRPSLDWWCPPVFHMPKPPVVESCTGCHAAPPSPPVQMLSTLGKKSAHRGSFLISTSTLPASSALASLEVGYAKEVIYYMCMQQQQQSTSVRSASQYQTANPSSFGLQEDSHRMKQEVVSLKQELQVAKAELETMEVGGCRFIFCLCVCVCVCVCVCFALMPALLWLVDFS